MKACHRHSIIAALAPLALAGAAGAAMADMAAPEMRVWSAALTEPDEEGMATSLAIVASASTNGSSGMVIESVTLIGTKTTEGEDGTPMTEVTSSVACSGPIMVEGGSFMIESAPMDEEAAMDEEKAEMADADEEAAEDPGCAFAVSGMARHTYRAWHSWDLTGSVNMGEAVSSFAIEGAAPAMILEPEPVQEGEEGEEGEG